VAVAEQDHEVRRAAAALADDDVAVDPSGAVEISDRDLAELEAVEDRDGEIEAAEVVAPEKQDVVVGGDDQAGAGSPEK